MSSHGGTDAPLCSRVALAASAHGPTAERGRLLRRATRRGRRHLTTRAARPASAQPGFGRGRRCAARHDPTTRACRRCAIRRARRSRRLRGAAACRLRAAALGGGLLRRRARSRCGTAARRAQRRGRLSRRWRGAELRDRRHRAVRLRSPRVGGRVVPRRQGGGRWRRQTDWRHRHAAPDRLHATSHRRRLARFVPTAPAAGSPVLAAVPSQVSRDSAQRVADRRRQRRMLLPAGAHSIAAVRLAAFSCGEPQRTHHVRSSHRLRSRPDAGVRARSHADSRSTALAAATHATPDAPPLRSTAGAPARSARRTRARLARRTADATAATPPAGAGSNASMRNSVIVKPAYSSGARPSSLRPTVAI